jgi:hypothetical protein
MNVLFRYLACFLLLLAPAAMASDGEHWIGKKGLKVIITTLPSCEGAFFRGPLITFCTPENVKVRQEVNTRVRNTKEFDGMIDFDKPVADPSHPARILPA